MSKIDRTASMLVNEQTGCETVVISREYWEELKGSDKFLDALRAAGVDNWDGYSYAHEIMNGEHD